MSEDEPSGFNAMGKPIGFDRRQAAYEAARQMGLGHAEAMSAVNSASYLLERDCPFEAQKVLMGKVDLTGAYRLFAHLLTPVRVPPKEAES